MDERGWNTGSQPQAGNTPAAAENPFEEPDQAPELRKERSDSLYSRDEPFWNRVVDVPDGSEKIQRDANYWNHPDVMDRDQLLRVDADTNLQKLRKFLGSGVVKKVLLVVAVLLVLAVILYGALFRVRMITVEGNTTIPGEVIVQLSGLKVGQSSATIDDEAVMRKIESNHYLRCTLVDVQGSTVHIHVRERVPAAYISHNGMTMVMDNRGFVLEESLQTHGNFENLVHVIGLDVRRSALGQQISLNSSAQLEAYTQIMVELKAMKALALLDELDMSSMDSIYLATNDNFYVRLGSEGSIHEKLRAFLITRDRVLEMGYTQGTIDVTNPGRPTYSP